MTDFTSSDLLSKIARLVKFVPPICIAESSRWIYFVEIVFTIFVRVVVRLFRDRQKVGIAKRENVF